VSQLDTFHFLHPAWLLALPLLLLVTVWLTRQRARDGSWGALVDPELLKLLRISESGRGQSPWPLLGAIWTLAVLALAGPAWRHEQTPAFRVPAAWVVVLDLSPSMSATDTPPDRVTRARYAITDLLYAAHDARVGLVVYAGEPHTVTPLTSDIATVRVLLRPLSPSLMPETGDRLAPALEQAGNLLGAVQGRDRQVIVLSDGSDDVASSLITAHRLREQGMTVNVIGVGTDAGAPAPDGKGGFLRDPRGVPRLTRVQTDALQRIASAGGGMFVPLSGLPQLSASLQAHRSGPLDAGEATGERLGHWRNEGVWLLPPLLLLAALLARRGWV
jgi:Ca-activated chloride channel family protein